MLNRQPGSEMTIPLLDDLRAISGVCPMVAMALTANGAGDTVATIVPQVERSRAALSTI
jgi:predicted flap endonuclease-1-like 5' DNA nuclease